MGYTHYWDILFTTTWVETWPQLVQDANLIAQAAGIRLTMDGEYSYEDYDDDDDDEHQNNGHDEPGPQIDDRAIHLNGPGGESHESFILEPHMEGFDCCKTLRKEYDVVVTAILLRASQLAGDAIKVRYGCFSCSNLTRDTDLLQLGWSLG